jgi:hypothetical protein
MTPIDWIGYSAIVLFFLYKPRAAPVATVDIGVPTVVGSGSGSLGGVDYLMKGNPYQGVIPGTTLPSTPDYYNSDGSPGYYLR